MEVRDKDLVCYSNKIKSVHFRKCLYDHSLINKAYLGDITATNIYKSSTHKMAAKTGWHRYRTKLRHCHPVWVWDRERWRLQLLLVIDAPRGVVCGVYVTGRESIRAASLCPIDRQQQQRVYCCGQKISIDRGALKIHDLKMTDKENCGSGKCKSGKWRTNF